MGKPAKETYDSLKVIINNMYRGWTQIEYQNKHLSIDQKDEGT
jgi:hypothetical protein